MNSPLIEKRVIVKNDTRRNPWRMEKQLTRFMLAKGAALHLEPKTEYCPEEPDHRNTFLNSGITTFSI